jgi:hypothetical protein
MGGAVGHGSSLGSSTVVARPGDAFDALFRRHGVELVSYCRRSTASDVTLVRAGDFVCEDCCFSPVDVPVKFITPNGALEHLRRHKRAGQRVPRAAMEQLSTEVEALR